MDHSEHMDHSMHAHHHHVAPAAASPSPEPDDVGALSMNGGHESHMHHMVDHMMSMAFHGGCNETILFEQWTVNSCSGLIISMAAIFVMATLYEGLKYYREHLFWKSYNALQYRAVQIPEKNAVTTEDGAKVVHMVGEVITKQPPSMLSWMHAYQTVLHLFQVTLSFLLMLIFMTYNTWLCLAVVFGAACGFFLFGWKKSVIVDVTEHCH